MRRIANIFILVIAFSCLIRCTEYEFPDPPYPTVRTLDVIEVSGTSVTFRGEINREGSDEEIVNHGFVWGTDDYLDMTFGKKIELGPIDGDGVYTADVTLHPDSTYYLRAFLVTDTYQVFSEVVSFRSK